MDPRAYLVAGLAVAALGGLALAAESQIETFLKPQDLDSGFAERDSVSGNLVALTAFLVAGGMTGAAALLARGPVRQRLLPLGLFYVSCYAVVFMLQTGMFNYQAIDLARTATFSISPLFANAPATPSVFIGPFALLMAAALGMAASGHRLSGRGFALRRPEQALGLFLGALALATPVLVIMLLGNLRLLLALGSDEPGMLPYLFVLPLVGLCAIAFLVAGSVKAWHLGQFVRNGRLAPVTREAWEAMRRVEMAAAGLLGLLALLAGLLEAREMVLLEAGRVFGLSARSHLQSQSLALVLLVPWFLSHATVLRFLAEHDSHSRTLAVGGVHPLVAGYWVAAGTGLVAAAAANWLLAGALWPWLMAAVPVAVFALVALPSGEGLLPAMLAATVLWGIGNTVTGDFQLATDTQFRYDTSQGLLALWRAMAVSMVAWAVARAARGRILMMRRNLAWPLTMALAVCVALIIFVELPFSAWVIRGPGGAEYVGIGTVVAAQDTAVRAVMHTLAAVGAFAAGLAVARVERPDWFGQGGSALSTPMPQLPDAAQA